MPGLEVVDVVDIETPFGAPSSPIVITSFEETQIAFIARHGPGHRLPPHEVPYRANVYALKVLGVKRIVRVQLPPPGTATPSQPSSSTTNSVGLSLLTTEYCRPAPWSSSEK